MVALISLSLSSHALNVLCAGINAACIRPGLSEGEGSIATGFCIKLFHGDMTRGLLLR